MYLDRDVDVDMALRKLSKKLDSIHSPSVDFLKRRMSLAVIGAGNYGVAFAERALSIGDDVPVVLASRKGKEDPKGFTMPCKVLSYEDAVARANIIVLAVPVDAFTDVVVRLGSKLNGKVIVDVSNSPPLTGSERVAQLLTRYTKEDTRTVSNAERLKNILDENKVANYTIVKAFNNISAYALTQPPNSSAMTKACMVSGEDQEAKKLVALLARRMGFEVMHLGGAEAALAQEGCVHKFFQSWTLAVAIACFLVALYTLYITLTYFVYGNVDWQTYPKRILLLVTGNVSASLLVLSFFPGPIASIWQLVRGTARRPFPTWFGNWLEIRKQLGLLAFFVCIPHVIISCVGSTPTELSLVYQFAPVFGTIGFALFYVMATCSNSSVSGHFTWSEFRFIFVRVGYGTVIMTAAHLACITYYSCVEGLINSAKANHAPPTVIFTLSLCCLAIVLKALVSVPPISTVVGQIRAQQNVSILPKCFLPEKSISFTDTSDTILDISVTDTTEVDISVTDTSETVAKAEDYSLDEACSSMNSEEFTSAVDMSFV